MIKQFYYVFQNLIRGKGIAPVLLVNSRTPQYIGHVCFKEPFENNIKVVSEKMKGICLTKNIIFRLLPQAIEN